MGLSSQLANQLILKDNVVYIVASDWIETTLRSARFGFHAVFQDLGVIKKNSLIVKVFIRNVRQATA